MNDCTHTSEIFEATSHAVPQINPQGDAVKKMTKRRKALLFVLASTVAKGALIAGAYFGLIGGHDVTTDNAYVGAATAQINAQIAGPVSQVRVDDTQMVHKGDILVVIDPADARLALARAEADLRRTVQRVAQYYAQQAGAAAQVQARMADLIRAQEDYVRKQKLADKGYASREALTLARTTYEAAGANLLAAQDSLEAQVILTRDFTPQSHPETVAALATLESARLDLERTIVRAPLDGVVTQRKVQVGQSISPGQALMSVTPIQDAYVDANFKEGQLRDVKIGQPVELISDLYGKKTVYHGRVTGLGGGTGSAFAVIPAQNATGNWIKVVQRVPVRITLDESELMQRPLRVGLSMKATIDTSEVFED